MADTTAAATPKTGDSTKKNVAKTIFVNFVILLAMGLASKAVYESQIKPRIPALNVNA